MQGVESTSKSANELRIAEGVDVRDSRRVVFRIKTQCAKITERNNRRIPYTSQGAADVLNYIANGLTIRLLSPNTVCTTRVR